MTEAAATVRAKGKRKWNFQPNLADQMAPFYHWPPQPGKTLRYIAASWGPLSVRIYILGLSVFTGTTDQYGGQARLTSLHARYPGCS